MNIANKISTFRILSVPFFIACLMYYSPQREFLRAAATAIFVIAVISDAVDGYIARKSKQYSTAGMILDPLGDKLLLMSSFICLTMFDKFAVRFPVWVTLVVISRDFIILLGVAVIYLVKQQVDFRPSRLGKLTTTFQMLAVFVLLLQLRVAYIFWWAAVVFTVLSCIDYIRKGFRILYAVDNIRHK